LILGFGFLCVVIKHEIDMTMVTRTFIPDPSMGPPIQRFGLGGLRKSFRESWKRGATLQRSVSSRIRDIFKTAPAGGRTATN